MPLTLSLLFIDQSHSCIYIYKKIKLLILKDTCTPMFITPFTLAKIWNKFISINRQTVYVYTYMLYIYMYVIYMCVIYVLYMCVCVYMFYIYICSVYIYVLYIYIYILNGILPNHKNWTSAICSNMDESRG